MKALFLVLMIIISSPVHAALEGGTGSQPVPVPAPPGGACNFQPLKDSLEKTESRGSGGYAAVNPEITKYGYARGKYQFVEETQETMLNKNPHCLIDPDTGAQMDCRKGNIINGSMGADGKPKGCWATQECLMDALLAENLDRAKKDKDCQDLIGKPVSGNGSWGPCSSTITWSGIAAGWHLGGDDACANVKRDGVGDNDGKTSEAYYMCLHSGVAVPGACTPAPYDPNVSAPTLTLPQINFLTDTGDTGFINTGANIIDTWVASMMLMAEQFTVNMSKQLEAIGMFFDAKEQLETQRLHQQMSAEAHKDYSPSEQMCTYGTFARDLASTERRVNLTRSALSQEILQRELGSGDSQGMTNQSDILSRIKTFRDNFCNPKDNGNGLSLLCPTAAPVEMQNRDIDYTRTIDAPLTLDVNLTDDETTQDEQAIFALIDNLFMHEPFERMGTEPTEQLAQQYKYLNDRSVVAMRGLARASIAGIIAQKSASPEHDDSNGPYLRALMKEMGVPDEEIIKRLGEQPSYYAQMEFLTKTMYQNPSFYTNLYDKPAKWDPLESTCRHASLSIL